MTAPQPGRTSGSRIGRAFIAVLGAGLLTLGSAAIAAPAYACTGDLCDGICYTYTALPPTVQQKVFHSNGCPFL